MEPKYDVTTKFDQTQKLVKCFSDSSEKMLTLGREVLKSRKKCWQLLWTVPNQLEIFQLFRTFWWAVPSITQVILVLVRGFAYQIYTSPNNGNSSERKDLDSCFGITSIMEFKFMTTVSIFYMTKSYPKTKSVLYHVLGHFQMFCFKWTLF